MLKCGKCKKEKAADDFPKNRARKSGRDNYCRLCKRASSQQSYIANRLARIAKNKAWQANNPAKVEAYKTLRRLTPEQWAEKRRSNKTTNMAAYNRYRHQAQILKKDIDSIRCGNVSVSPNKASKCPIFNSPFIGVKPCTKCGEVKNLRDFPKASNRRLGVGSACKRCTYNRVSGWAIRNKDHLRSLARKRYARSGKVRESSLHRTKAYKARKKGCSVRDLTSNQWEQIKAFYRYRCAYCGQEKPLTQDHVIPISKGGDHTASNIVPACQSCNSSKGASLPKVSYQPHLLA